MSEAVDSLLDKLAVIEREIAAEKGGFSLFGLVLREDAQDYWDLVVIAPWIGEKKRDALEIIAQRLQSSLDRDELLLLSRIVILGDGDPLQVAIRRLIRVEHGRASFGRIRTPTVQLDKTYIITSV